MWRFESLHSFHLGLAKLLRPWKSHMSHLKLCVPIQRKSLANKSLWVGYGVCSPIGELDNSRSATKLVTTLFFICYFIERCHCMRRVCFEWLNSRTTRRKSVSSCWHSANKWILINRSIHYNFEISKNAESECDASIIDEKNHLKYLKAMWSDRKTKSVLYGTSWL